MTIYCTVLITLFSVVHTQDGSSKALAWPTSSPLFSRVVSETPALRLLYQQQLQQKLQISTFSLLKNQTKYRHHIKETQKFKQLTIPWLFPHDLDNNSSIKNVNSSFPQQTRVLTNAPCLHSQSRSRKIREESARSRVQTYHKLKLAHTVTCQITFYSLLLYRQPRST